MKRIVVGAFEAKTHLSQLLDDVEKGAEVEITRRGRPVAVLRPAEAVRRRSALDALERLAVYRDTVDQEELEALVNEGRER